MLAKIFWWGLLANVVSMIASLDYDTLARVYVSAIGLVFLDIFRRWVIRRRRAATRLRFGVVDGATVIAFYHPFCASGGGGECVLWKMLSTLQTLTQDGSLKLHIVIYAAEEVIPSPDLTLNLINFQWKKTGHQPFFKSG